MRCITPARISPSFPLLTLYLGLRFYQLLRKIVTLSTDVHNFVSLLHVGAAPLLRQRLLTD